MPGPCQSPNQHCVEVSVKVQPDGTWKIAVDRPEVTIRAAQQEIFWVIKNTGTQTYKFPSDGIGFKTPAGKAQFGCASMGPGMNDIVFRCHDHFTAKGRFEYGIKLDGSPAVPPWDPFVVND